MLEFSGEGRDRAYSLRGRPSDSFNLPFRIAVQVLSSQFRSRNVRLQKKTETLVNKDEESLESLLREK